MKTSVLSIDAMRGILAYFVILIHLKPLCCGDDYADSFVNVVARIAVPLFFCISGFLNYRRIQELDFLRFLSKLARSVLVPYFSISLLAAFLLWVVSMILGEVVILGYQFPLSIYSFADFIFGFDGYPGLFHLWFLRNLFLAAIFVYFFRPNVSKGLAWLLLYASAIAWAAAEYESKFLSLYIESISSFLAGYLIARLLAMNALNWHCFLIFFAGLSSSEFILAALGSQDVGRSLIPILAALFVLGFVYYFDVKGFKLPYLLTKASEFSLPIYLFHLPFVLIFILVLDGEPNFGFLEISLSAFFVFCFSYIFSYLLRQVLPVCYILMVGK
ncbi:acyltransferase [Spongiibacter nanhainus]|uniref:Acyltransferase n=1 Tax=Spongiibacter nanhainus TaxID=2794344 RepID=A0A7T4R2U3_9GAMM|nr:acyltransferase [Spongiibacter nanhainus]QQD19438.1 acyltransferase [Spongiibacter nanhainus]